MRAYLMSGVVFLMISAIFVTLAYVMAYYEDVYRGVAESKKMDTLYNAATDASRVLALGDNNALQDALSDAVADALVYANFDNATNRTNLFCNVGGAYNYSVGGAVNKSDLVEHANFSVIRYFFGMTDANQYGGLTGCGANYIINSPSAPDNLLGGTNCEAAPYDAGNATTNVASSMLSQVSAACKKLTDNQSAFLKEMVYNYSYAALYDLSTQYGAEIRSLVINATFTPDRACDVGSLASTNGTIRITANVSYEYALKYADVEKTARLLTSRQVLLGGKEKGIGTVASRVFGISANVSGKNYTYNTTADCTLTCSENTTQYKDTTENLEWANIQVINTPRTGLPPTLYWRFDKNFHLRTFYNERAGTCSVCQRIFSDSNADCGTVCSLYPDDVSYCGNVTVVSPSHVTKNIAINNRTCFKESCGEYTYGW